MSEPRLAAIVPAGDDPPTLGSCLAAIRDGEVVPDQIVVVDRPRGAGPAALRNLGARRASSEVLVFIDSDVVVAPDALARIRDAFADDPSLGAVFGSYDDAPPAPGRVSAFRNLLHHHVHQVSAGEASSFWAGLGAVRSDLFRDCGGFDAELYPRSSIEDVELGARLARGGARIVLDPAIRGTHLKRWSLGSMIRTDLLRRGVPWVELACRDATTRRALNLAPAHRASAALSAMAVLSLAGRRPAGAAVSLAAVAWLNRGFYALLLRRRGLAGVVAGFGLHLLHQLTAVAALPIGLARHLRRRRAVGGGAQNEHQRS